jgi:putative colanic acid biosysnthesis UDP-glucose lipid carrier transferase
MLEGKIRTLSHHYVKPGMIGWARVHGYGGETGTIEYIKRRIEYDLYYVENRSLLLDIRIIFMTIIAEGSYARK